MRLRCVAGQTGSVQTLCRPPTCDVLVTLVLQPRCGRHCAQRVWNLQMHVMNCIDASVQSAPVRSLLLKRVSEIMLTEVLASLHCC